jgi:hypothetical protein
VQKWIVAGKEDPEGFWGRAAEQLPWLRKWDRVLDWTPPTFKWFVGGQTNLAYNALDYHVKRGWSGHTALIYLNERGERRIFTYAQLLYEVERVAAALRGMGIKKGDRLTVYMPTCPEAIILMLATVRIGAIHSVVFAGFGAKALGDRIRASGSRLVFTADVTYRKGKNTDLKLIVDEALQGGSDVEPEQKSRGLRDATCPGKISSAAAPGTAATMFRWKPTKPHLFSPLPAPPRPRSWRCTPTVVIRFISTAWASGCLTSNPPMCGGQPPTLDGS